MNADFSELRVKMVDGQVRTTDVTNPAILDAMLAIPREAFVDEGAPRARLYRRGHRDRPRALSDGAVALRQAGAACRHPPGRNRARCRRRHRLLGGRAVAAGRPGRGAGKRCGARRAGAGGACRAWRPTMSRSSSARSPPAMPKPRPMTSSSSKARRGAAGRALCRSCARAAGWSRSRATAMPAWRASTSNRVALVTGRRAFNAAVKPLPGFERTPAFEF